MTLRIALFTYSTKPRGSVIHTLELANALHQLGHDVCIYALDKDGTGFDWPIQCQYQPVPAQPAGANFDRLIQQRIQELSDYLGNGHLAAHPYDCYHAQDCLTANALAMLRPNQIPHLLRTVHHIDDFNSSYLQQCQDRSIREPDCCLCVSRYWQEQLQQRYQVHALRVNNGVNLKRFSNRPDGSEDSLKQQLGLVGKPIYLTIGGIEPRKNTICLLQAFAQVLLQQPHAQLVIAGGATLFDYQTYRDDFFAEVDRLEIQIGQSLILPGVISDADLPTLYRVADAFVFPSLKEGWGLVVLEAIASELPVIVPNQAPFTEFLQPDQAVWVEPQSVNSIAEAMLRAVKPNAVSIQPEQICSQFSWTNSAKMHVEHYYKLLNYA